MTKHGTQDRIVATVCSILTAGGSTVLQPELWPATLSCLIVLLIVIKLSNDQLVRVLKYVLIVMTVIVLSMTAVALAGVYWLWRVFS